MPGVLKEAYFSDFISAALLFDCFLLNHSDM